MEKIKFTETEILDSLSRSGYLLESEITKRLVNYGFFVESNLSSLDPLTGKSREIDLFAENNYDATKKSESKCIALVRFIFEIKNNDFPLVLLTKFENSPNSNIWEGFKIAQTIPEKIFDTYYFNDFTHILLYQDESDMFTQYCSFSHKKNEELMAHHPENLYSSLLKLTQYCEEMIEPWANNKSRHQGDNWFRNFLYLPVLLINDDLFELEITDDNKNVLKKVDSSRLIFNYHYKQEPKTSIIYVVTKSGLEEFLKKVLLVEKKVEESMIDLWQGDA